MKMDKYLLMLILLAVNAVSANEITQGRSGVTAEFIEATPCRMKITFDKSVTLDSITIKDNDGFLLVLDTQVPEGGNTIFSFEIPKLTPADYQILWTGLEVNNVLKHGNIKLAIQDDDIYPRPAKMKFGILHRKWKH
ncbi:hypothetical protein AB4140_19625 [Shewanella sp. 10N.286.51.B2]|uniref:hypothetical protein n=1 Tax=unclassified Shewanella TaxID=196818 RepID=UPI0026E38A3A|nr:MULTISPECIES: hypothetical protein [unclassified Shewanella]MDO6619226.1 hypothetical protein [Shewanella sp. 6_MG-2023]MDO6678886.1 hypothetical protein [Shewanella sp. 4_MG-2023]